MAKKIKIKSYAGGGKVQGRSHTQGGVPAVDANGQQVAEIEGNERIFSVEDTLELEQTALAITELPAQEADSAAKQLGYRVVDMIKAQDTNQGLQEQPQVAPSPEAQANFEEVDPAIAGLT